MANTDHAAKREAGKKSAKKVKKPIQTLADLMPLKKAIGLLKHWNILNDSMDDTAAMKNVLKAQIATEVYLTSVEG